MRILLLYFLASVIVLPVQSQVCKISGKFPGNGEVVISYNSSSFLTTIRDTISIDPDGRFSYEVRLDGEPRKCYLKFSDKELVVWATELETIAIELGKDDQTTFAGETKDIQYYLLNKDSEWSKIYSNFQRNDLFNHLSKPHTDEYFKIQDQITASRIENLKKSVFRQNNDSTFYTDFIRRETEDLIFMNLYYKLTYNNARIDKFEFISGKKGVSNQEYYGYTQKSPFNDRPVLKSQQFLAFANMFFLQKAVKSMRRQNLAGERETYFRQVFAAIDSTAHDEYCNQIHKIYFLADELKGLILGGNQLDLTPELFNKYLATIENYPPTAKDILALKILYEARHAELENLVGVSVDDCLFFDQGGAQFDLKSLRGKLIYIDVWASWCAPCLESVPSWNALVKKWEANENINFLMISIDSSGDKWKHALAKYKPEGLQLISPGDFERSDFAKTLKLESLPAYILVDKNGKAISTKGPRPDSIQLIPLLESYSPR